MRIALDATPLIEPYGGIPRYVTELAAALAEGFPADQIHLLSDQPNLHLAPRLEAAPNVVLEAPSGPSFGGKWWSLGLPWELRKRRIEVFHGTNFEVPYLHAVPSILTLHDLSPWHEPPIRPEGSERVRRRAPWLLKRARFVLTPTEAIRSEACARFGLDPDRVQAVPHGISNGARTPDPAQAAELGVSPPFLLYLGAAGPRKNLEMAVTAWRAARKALPKLAFVLAGPGTERFQGRCAGLIGLGPISQLQANSLLAAAAAFVYPSLYEGFGLPIVEAMRANAPVLVSRDPALLETAGDAAIAADADDAAQWTGAMVDVVSNPEVAAGLRERASRRAAAFDWRVTAERTRAIYARAIRRR